MVAFDKESKELLDSVLERRIEAIRKMQDAANSYEE